MMASQMKPLPSTFFSLSVFDQLLQLTEKKRQLVLTVGPDGLNCFHPAVCAICYVLPQKL
jgi:hypothetical protein